MTIEFDHNNYWEYFIIKSIDDEDQMGLGWTDFGLGKHSSIM